MTAGWVEESEKRSARSSLQMNTSEEIKMAHDQTVTVETLKQFLDAFNRHDLDAIMEFFSDDCCMDLPRGPAPWGTRLTGKGQVRAGCASRFTGPNEGIATLAQAAIQRLGY